MQIWIEGALKAWWVSELAATLSSPTSNAPFSSVASHECDNEWRQTIQLHSRWRRWRLRSLHAMPQFSLGRGEKPTMDRILLIGLLFSAVCACLGKPADSAGPVAGIWWYLVYCAACWLALVHFLICTSGIATTTNACTCTPANVTAAAGAPTEVNCVCPNAAAVATANVTAAAAPPVGNWLRCVRKI